MCRRLLSLGARRKEVRVSRIGDLTDGSSSTFNSSPLVVYLPSSVQLPMSHEALSIGKHLPTQIAFIVLLTRVHSQMLGEVERLAEHFSTHVAGMRLLPRVDAVVTPQGLCPSEAFATNLTAVWPFRPIPWRSRAPSPPDDGARVSFLSGLPWPPVLRVGLARVGQRHGGTVEAGC